MVKAKDFSARCPFVCSGTKAASAGCAMGATDADARIARLLHAHSRDEVRRHLRELASKERAKQAIYPYFRQTPRPE